MKSISKKTWIIAAAALLIIAVGVVGWRVCLRETGEQDAPAYVVWSGWDDEDYEIYIYQISSGVTKQITNNEEDDLFPEISGDYVVWHGREDWEWDVYLYQISIGKTINVSNDPADEYHPDSFPQVYGDYMTWSTGVDGDFLYQLSNSTMTHILDYTSGVRNPQINDDYVVWEGKADRNSEIFLYQIKSGVITRISNNLANDV